ncbi:putative glycosyltransferase CsbB [compost metagenome]
MNNIQPELSIVIPVFNEGMHIQESLVIIAEEVSHLTDRFEMIIVDDGSSDETWEQLEELKALLPELTGLRLSRNFGKELALCAGLEHASGQAIIVMDADLQHPPSLLPEMVRLWREEKKEIVECTKTYRGQEPLQKKIGSNLFYWILNKTSGFDLQGASDFKLLDQKVLKSWREMPERNTFFRGMSAWLGFDRAVISFEVPARSNGVSRWGLLSLIKLAVNAIVSFSSVPLRMVSVIGLIFLVVAGVMGIQTLYQKLGGNAVTGFTTVILLLLIIGSVIMISLGIIGEYIASIYNEVKGRPRFLIRDKLNGDKQQA